MATNQTKILESQIREIYARVVWTHKTHEKSTDRLYRWNQMTKWLHAILSTLITCGTLTIVFGNVTWVTIVIAIISAILTIISFLTINQDFGLEYQRHIASCNALRSIREQYLSLLVDIKANLLTIEEIINRRDLLHKELECIYNDCPRTTRCDYKKASEALKSGGEMTLTHEEIDRFLIEDLQRLKQQQ